MNGSRKAILRAATFALPALVNPGGDGAAAIEGYPRQSPFTIAPRNYSEPIEDIITQDRELAALR